MSYKYMKDNNTKKYALIFKNSASRKEIKIVFISKTRHAKWDYSLQTYFCTLSCAFVFIVVLKTWLTVKVKVNSIVSICRSSLLW